ncbi:cell division protein FtsL [Marinobacter changyiensis]|uniref:cell division protein FtsL n=1 Tax=Marinobacter changyiensis TaxID=2604091 RepID=UPI001264D0F5|nr:cell division protein FtsL [Marinobacter changyiensis]
MSAVTIDRPVKTAPMSRKKMRAGLATTLGLSKQIFQSVCQRNILISLMLVFVLIASSIGVAVSGHQSRDLFNTLSQLQIERDQYQREWSQLLLEQSALSAHGRIESRAGQSLSMVVPGRESIVLVPAPMPYALAH